MSDIYFIGQPRFGANPKQLTDAQRYEIWDDSESMNQDLISYWNEKVNPEDSIYILGEFFEKSVKEKVQSQIIDQLNGKKIFIQNQNDVIHNYNNSNMITYHDIQFLYGRNLIHLTNFLEHINTIDSNFVITSISCILNRKVYNQNIKYIDKSGAMLFKNNLSKPVINVCVDIWEFRPISLEEVLKSYSDYFRNQFC